MNLNKVISPKAPAVMRDVDVSENLQSAVGSVYAAKMLKLGDKGEDVKALQQKLNKFGYNLAIDGDFGQATYSAVRDFQSKFHIPANGEVDSSILSLMEISPSEYAARKTEPISKSSDNISNNNSIEYFINGQDCSSVTSNFIYVSLSKQMVYIFQGSNKKWSLEKSFTCSSGKSSTPTIRGHFKAGSKGAYFIAEGGARCKYYTQISGNYLFHSVLYDNSGNVIIDATQGVPASHGCIRLKTENAKYIYDNVPYSTEIWIE